VAGKKKKGLIWAIVGGIVAILAVFGLVKERKAEAKKS